MDTEDGASFAPRRARQWRRTALLLASGAAALAVARLPGPHPLAWLAALVLLPAALATLLALARDRPRLLVDRAGLTLLSAWRTTVVPWDSIGAFSLAAGPRGRQRAVAPWLARRRRWRRREGLALPDAFDAPLPLVLDMIAVRRPDTPGIAAAPPPDRPCGVPGFRVPWLTLSVLAVLVAVFAIERRVGLVLGTVPGTPGDPSVATLVALGGESRALVDQGQFHRILSAPLLHGGMAHLLGNAVALALGGWALERLVGRAWMACILATGALGGSLASLALSPPRVVSVGASGAIMALLVALAFTSIRMPQGRRKTAIQVQTIRTAIPALLPFGHGAAHTDFGAHLGGAVVGLVLGVLLLRNWQDDRPLPDLRPGAAALAAMALVAFAGSGVAVARGYGEDPTVQAGRIPAARLPPDLLADPSGMAPAVDALLADYPRDPRAHLLAGRLRLSREDLPGAETEFRTARRLATAAPDGLSPQLPAILSATLAMTLLAERRAPEALDAAAPACAATGPLALAPQGMATLARARLCPQYEAPPAAPVPPPAPMPVPVPARAH